MPGQHRDLAVIVRRGKKVTRIARRDGDRRFVPGLVAFLSAHVAYTVGLVIAPDWSWRAFGAALVAVARNDEARTAADVSTASFAVGAAALGVGAYFLLTGSDDEAAGERTRLAPTVNHGSAGLVVDGTF